MRISGWVVAALVWLGAVSVAQAETRGDDPQSGGELVARDAEGKALGACPLRHTEVRAEVAGFVARTVVVQTFENPFEMPIEAVYTFPLPAEGAVDALWIRSGDRRIRGEIRRREEARKIYEQARASGQLAALLDEERPNIFTQSVANLAPGQAVEIEIQYVAPLAYEAGSFELVFPTVVGPRFIAGTAQVPNAQRITPPIVPEGMRAGHDLSISVDIDAGVPIRSVRSALHEIDVERPAPSRARVRLAERAAIPNRDFVLRYEVAGGDLQSGYLAHRGESGDGYLTLVLLPPRRAQAAEIAPREIVFVIDRSGSQSGRPLEKARETMLWMLDHLNPNDTFQIVSFSNQSEQLFAEPQRVTRASLTAARAYIAGLQANGGTFMADAVQRICAAPASAHRLRIVTFMTDGYVGDDDQILDLVQRLRGTSRWFPFGTGNSVNRYLLDGMAKQGGGEVEYVLLNESGERVARKFYQRIAEPLLTDVSVEIAGLDVVDVLPSRHADVWAEKPLVIHARYRSAGRGRVVLRGYRAGKPYEQTLDVALPAKRVEGAALASVWARAKVESLEAQDLGGLQRGSFDAKLREEIVTVALAHKLVTRFTSFVAVDESARVNGEAVLVPVPVEMPQGVEYEGIYGAPGSMQMRRVREGPQALRPTMAREKESLNPPSAPEPVQEARPEPTSPPAPQPGLEKLDATLAALVGGRTYETPLLQPDGSLRVRIDVGRADSVVLRALAAAGFKLASVDVRGPTLLGTLTLESLRKIIALDAVKRVMFDGQRAR